MAGQRGPGQDDRRQGGQRTGTGTMTTPNDNGRGMRTRTIGRQRHPAPAPTAASNCSQGGQRVFQRPEDTPTPTTDNEGNDNTGQQQHPRHREDGMGRETGANDHGVICTPGNFLCVRLSFFLLKLTYVFFIYRFSYVRTTGHPQNHKASHHHTSTPTTQTQRPPTPVSNCSQGGSQVLPSNDDGDKQMDTRTSRRQMTHHPQPYEQLLVVECECAMTARTPRTPQ
jgi:hypothetical protein